MIWNWQQPDWPKFTWNTSRLSQAEQLFLVGAGTLMGAVKHLDGEERSQITIEAISTTSAHPKDHKVFLAEFRPPGMGFHR